MLFSHGTDYSQFPQISWQNFGIFVGPNKSGNPVPNAADLALSVVRS
jgi:hypothetical protein